MTRLGRRSERRNFSFKWKKLFVIFLIIMLFLTVLLLLLNKVTSRFRSDKYDKIVEVNYKGKLRLKSPVVCYGNKIYCKNIKPIIKSKVDVNKLGEYKVDYIYEYKKKKTILSQKVIVKDLEKPEILLKSDDIEVCPNGKILKLDIEITDNFDGDITDKANISFKNKELFIEVKDKADNKSEKKINVNPIDKKEPKITINGDNSVVVVKGLEYNDQGAKVVDNCDDDINIKTDGKVDINNVGTYKITYSAVDSSGNNASAVRTVTVKEREIGNKVVYLTFDDGPGPYTQELLDVLDKYDAKVTFFVTNQFPKYQNMIAEEAKRGHTVAIHSLTHKWDIYDSVENYLNDLEAMNDIVEKQTGQRSSIFRFPGGSSNTIYCSHNKTAVLDIINATKEKGYVYFDWNVSSGDAGETTSTDKVYKNVIKYMRNNAVVLQHDIKGFSVRAVEKILIYGINNGYTFKALTTNSPISHHGVHICK